VERSHFPPPPANPRQPAEQSGGLEVPSSNLGAPISKGSAERALKARARGEVDLEPSIPLRAAVDPERDPAASSIRCPTRPPQTPVARATAMRLRVRGWTGASAASLRSRRPALLVGTGLARVDMAARAELSLGTRRAVEREHRLLERVVRIECEECAPAERIVLCDDRALLAGQSHAWVSVGRSVRLVDSLGTLCHGSTLRAVARNALRGKTLARGERRDGTSAQIPRYSFDGLCRP
jgi:hypothetical protein